MKREWIVLIVVWSIGLGLLLLIPKDKRRLALVAFLFKQAITWMFGLLVVEYGLISYPVRLFASVNRTSFSYEFFLFPVTCSLFNAFYPTTQSWKVKMLYYILCCTILTVPEVVIEKHTDLIHYIHWSWTLTWVTILVTFFLTHLFCLWFFKELLPINPYVNVNQSKKA